MAAVEKSVLLAYTPAQMFALGDAVEDYPQFLPWCGASKVEFRDEHCTRATLQIDYHGIKQSFTTENTKQTAEQIEIRLVRGPFKSLDGNWRFIALGEHACKVELKLHYEFSSKLLALAVGPVFHYIANTLVEAFSRRAASVY